MNIGGLGPEQPATEHVQALCNKVKPDIQRACNADNFEVFIALKYRAQIVAGLNYFVKIQITDGEGCIHVNIIEGPGNSDVSLLGVQKWKTIDDPIIGF